MLIRRRSMRLARVHLIALFSFCLSLSQETLGVGGTDPKLHTGTTTGTHEKTTDIGQKVSVRTATQERSSEAFCLAPHRTRSLAGLCALLV